MKKIVLLITLLLTSHITLACEWCNPLGRPVGEGGIDLSHTGYSLNYNTRTNTANWVSYRIQKSDVLNPKVNRIDRFKPDDKLPEINRVVHSDYTHTGYDRGHLAPAATMRWSTPAMLDSFLMSNITPQVGIGFNRGIWKNLEKNMRQWACVRNTLYIITGPIYQHDKGKLIADRNKDGIDDNGIVVDIPSHFYKIALDPRRIDALAFIIPNEKIIDDNLRLYQTSINEIESITGLDFFPVMNNNVEKIVEAFIPTIWSLPDNDKMCSGIN